MQLQDLNVDMIWGHILGCIQVGSHIPTLKGGKRNGVEVTAEVISIKDETIEILLDNNEIRNINKRYYDQVISELDKKGRVRQLNIPGHTERYVLGVLKLLPYLEKVKEYDALEGKDKHFIKLKGQ